MPQLRRERRLLAHGREPYTATARTLMHMHDGHYGAADIATPSTPLPARGYNVMITTPLPARHYSQGRRVAPHLLSPFY
jgi:hypothetical protein